MTVRTELREAAGLLAALGLSTSFLCFSITIISFSPADFFNCLTGIYEKIPTRAGSDEMKLIYLAALPSGGVAQSEDRRISPPAKTG